MIKFASGIRYIARAGTQEFKKKEEFVDLHQETWTRLQKGSEFYVQEGGIRLKALLAAGKEGMKRGGRRGESS